MLTPGSISGSNWVEAASLARSIENEMVADKLVDLVEETEDAAKARRQYLIAISRGIINYIKTHLDLQIAAGALKGPADAVDQIPPAVRTLSGTVR